MFIMTTQDLAARLSAARRNDDCLKEALGPSSLTEAYAIQQRVDTLDTSPILGYKLGATTAEILGIVALDEPFIGCLHASNHYDSGTGITTPRAYPIKVEAEFVVGLKQDLNPLPERFSPKQVPSELVAMVAESVAWIAPGLELVGSRLTGIQKHPGLALIADSASNVATLTGSENTDFEAYDIATHEVSIAVNNTVMAHGTGGDSLGGHPFAMIAWMLTHPSLEQQGLKAGQFIFCGTCTGALPVAAGDTVTADFGALGAVSTRLL